MKDQNEIKDLFDEKYERILGMSYAQWQQSGPQTDQEAYARCAAIDQELNRTYNEWYEATGDKKDHLDDYRQKLKSEYDLLVDIYNLEFEDRDY